MNKRKLCMVKCVRMVNNRISRVIRKKVHIGLLQFFYLFLIFFSRVDKNFFCGQMIDNAMLILSKFAFRDVSFTDLFGVYGIFSGRDLCPKHTKCADWIQCIKCNIHIT